MEPALIVKAKVNAPTVTEMANESLRPKITQVKVLNSLTMKNLAHSVKEQANVTTAKVQVNVALVTAKENLRTGNNLVTKKVQNKGIISWLKNHSVLLSVMAGESVTTVQTT